MKIRLLLRREPFADILQQTLQGYADATGHGPVAVRWRDAPFWSRSRSANNGEWYCNSELNVIFSPHVDAAALRPIVNEFSTSPHRWRRSVQHYYVDAALHPRIAQWFADARLTMSPEWMDPHHQILVPGNQKIRVLDRGQRRATAIWKAGFPRIDLLREIDGRQLAAKNAVRVPRLLETNTGDGWYQEEYIVSTPLNRLMDPADQATAARRAWDQLKNLLYHTTEYLTLEEYVRKRVLEVQALASSLPWLSNAERNAIFGHVEVLRDLVIAGEPRRTIATAMTHGDFQPANIVVDENDVWVIDWECFDRRQITYDIWVLATSARAPHGLADRIRTAIRGGIDSTACGMLLQEAAASMTDLPIARQAALFALEEVSARLAADSNPLFPAGAGGIRSFVPTLDAWQRTIS